MDVEFFLHGIPNGEDFWGKEEERSFFGTFYDSSSDNLKFLIQARTIGGKPYFYYSYLVYADVVDNNGRPGSYFGMTLRLDEYCKEFMNLYRILDTVYNSYVVGKLLVNDKSKLKYSVPKFGNFSINGIYDKVKRLLQDTLSNDSFSKVGNISLGGNPYRKCNLYDCTNDTVLSDIRQYGKIAISPYYPSMNESSMQQQCDNRINAIRKQCEERINATASQYAQKEQTANAAIRELQSQNAQLNASIQQRNADVNRLQQKVNELSNALNQERQNKDIERLVEQIKEPVKSLAEILDGRKHQPHGGKGKHGHKSEKRMPSESYYDDDEGFKLPSKRYVIGTLVLVVAAVIVFACLKCCGKDASNKGTEHAQTGMVDTITYIVDGKEKQEN